MGWKLGGALVVAAAGAAAGYVVLADPGAASRRVVVLDFPRTPQNADAGAALLALLSDEVRSGALEAVKRGGLSMPTREATHEALKRAGATEECAADAIECEGGKLRAIGARYGVSGRLARLPEGWMLSLQFIDVENKELVAAERMESDDEEQLLTLIQPASERLAEKGLRLTKVHVAATALATAPDPVPDPAVVGEITHKFGSELWGLDVGSYNQNLRYGRLTPGAQLQLMSRRIERNQFGAPVVKVKIVTNGTWQSKIGRVGWMLLEDTTFKSLADEKQTTIR